MSMPAFDRDVFFDYLSRNANHFGVVCLNQSNAASRLQCHRASVTRMVRDLEREGRVVRRRRKGSRGIMLTVVRQGDSVRR
jgi:DNA-binding MarR family transcriptional regulator